MRIAGLSESHGVDLVQRSVLPRMNRQEDVCTGFCCDLLATLDRRRVSLEAVQLACEISDTISVWTRSVPSPQHPKMLLTSIPEGHQRRDRAGSVTGGEMQRETSITKGQVHAVRRDHIFGGLVIRG